MKIILSTYTFTASAKTVDFSAVSGFDIKRLLAIINQKTGQLIYSTSSTTIGYTSISGNVVTLAFDTTAMSNTDPLTIIYQSQSAGIGNLLPVPAGSTNGTAIATLPSNASAVRFYLPVGTVVSFTITATAPTAAPTNVFTIANNTTGYNWDEPIPYGMNIYITAITGSPLFRIF